MAIRYFIPDWDDRVDPTYNFSADLHTEGRDPYRDDTYAHEIFDTAPYDGILMSLATLDQRLSKRRSILDAGSVHRYLRLPIDGKHEVLGDCGAFTYWRDEMPPYKSEQVLEYYQKLGFNLGVSIDHLIFAEIASDKERRWQITIDNAEEFLKLHRSGRYTFTPIGVAQGWDPPSYRRAVQALVKMGYNYIAIGGIVRTPTPDIIRMLSAVKPELPAGMGVHLFGVSRPEYAHVFAGLGVTSFDSASRLRRAWLDGRRNYFIGETAYTAVRIPYAGTIAKKRSLSEGETIELERRALVAVRAYDAGEASLAEALRAVEEYDAIALDLSLPTKRDYARTLREAPWKQCPCAICKSIGVEVIIFRGNNRNRRRGFHNIWQLNQQLQSGRQRLASEAELATQLAFSP
ncbi:MAG TPA: tRNA-guanine transglycosylase DpdA [Chloroflexia bacterium]|nr:tRNA-guanine transglycosylase DpdA [Chloroflexia bacterium]